MRTLHLSAAILLCVSATFASVGCDDHYTTQEATATCTDLTERNPATNPQTSFDDCVDCFETCGIDCEQAGTSPETYVCPDETGAAGGSGG